MTIHCVVDKMFAIEKPGGRINKHHKNQITTEETIMLPIITANNAVWHHLRQVLIRVTLPLLLAPGLFHVSLSTNFLNTFGNAEKNSPKLLALRAENEILSVKFRTELPATSFAYGVIPRSHQRVLEPTLPAKLSASDLYWVGFTMQDLAKASWVLVDGGFSLPIMQQPNGDTMYVSSKANMITQFSRPADNGVTALLAHNYRSGVQFYELAVGQKITVTYGGSITRDYEVVSMNRFQKVIPSDRYSDLIDLETNITMTSTEVYNRFYRGTPRVTFQTCLEKDGNLEWGLYFVVAEPVSN